MFMVARLYENKGQRLYDMKIKSKDILKFRGIPKTYQ
jgi:hypothetical protein